MAIANYPTLRSVSPVQFTDEDSPIIYYVVPATASVRKLEACIADASTGTEIYIAYREVDMTATSYTFNFTSSELTALYDILGDLTTMDVRFYLKTTTETGAIHLDSLESSFRIVNANPTISPVAEDVNTTTVALTENVNAIIPGFSSIQFRSNAAARKGATIVSQTVICGSRKSNAGSGTFENVENGTITFTAVDSRGLSTFRTIQFEVIDYVKVSCRQNVVLNEDGTVEITLTGNYFDGNFGLEDNELTLEIRHTQNDGTMGDWVDLSALLYDIDGNTYSLTHTISGFDQSGTYEFQSRASDKLGTATTARQTITWYPIFDWSKNDFNFNVPVIIEGGKAYGVHTLYDGSTAGNVILNDEIDNYDFIDIYFTDNNGRGSASARLFGVDGGSKTIDLALIEASSATNTYIRRTAYICKDRTLSPNITTAGYLSFYNDPTQVAMIDGTNYIKVIKVLGYK